jgi:hypothetical protein
VVLHEAFDFAAGSVAFEDADARLRHRRAVLRYGERYWLVFDLVLGFGVHGIEALWHFHPDLSVRVDGAAVATRDDGAAGLSILAVGDVDWKVELVTGQTRPEVQGWFSERYNEKIPATAAVYRARQRTPAVFAWLIAPRRSAGPAPRVEHLPSSPGTVRLRIDSEEIAVRMHGNAPLQLSDGSRVDGELAIAIDSARLYPTR